jgi:hypothetical protein
VGFSFGKTPLACKISRSLSLKLAFSLARKLRGKSFSFQFCFNGLVLIFSIPFSEKGQRGYFVVLCQPI